MTTGDLTAAVRALDGNTVAVALERFVQANPHYRGAHWDDAVDELLNADAHLDLTESAPDLDAAVAAITAYWAGTFPTIQTVCRVHIPAPICEPGFVVENPLVTAFMEWMIHERVWSIPGTVSCGPHMFVGDFPIEDQGRIVAWFKANGVSHGGVQSTG